MTRLDGTRRLARNRGMRRLLSPSVSIVLLSAATACFNPGSTPITGSGTDTDGPTTDASESVDETVGDACADGVMNGEETDVDCGGPTCEACGTGQGCQAPSDCVSMTCDAGTCVDPSCEDGAMNGEESDVDCGGSACPTCADGQGCGDGSDCASGVCSDGACQAPTCGDGVVNTDGEDCDDAGDSLACNADCTATACGDGLVNMAAGEDCDELGETDVCDADCTLVECGDRQLNTTAGEVCDDGADSTDCDADCTLVECGDGLANGAAGEACDDGEQTAACDADCTAPMCGDGVVNGLADEQCDDGDGIDDNLCSNACAFNTCVFDTGLLPVTVHPNNSFGDLDFDGSCNLLVSGAFEGTLLRVDALTGVVSTLVMPFAGSSSVNGVAHRVSNGLTYVATDGSPILWSVAADGTLVQVMALPTTINAIAVAPPGFGAFGDQIIGVGTDGAVYAFDPDIASTAVVGNAGTLLSDLAFDPATATLYVAANGNGQVLTMSAAGAVGMVAMGFSGIDGVAVDPVGTLYVADTNAQTVTAIDLASGAQMVVANPMFDGGYYVTGLLVDGAGTLLMKVGNVGFGADIDYISP
jgi:sugar lactone lactonase YvrE